MKGGARSQSLIIEPSPADMAMIAGGWTEASIVAEPTHTPIKPSVLVRRNVPNLRSSRGDDLFVLPGRSAISLFTGAGGMDIGTEAAGFCTLVQHEYMYGECKTLICNRPQHFRHAALIQGDIRETPTSMLLREAGLRTGEADLVTGGPPCQGFSTANSKSSSGTYDSRNDLVFEFLRVVREVQPKAFVMENVPGFLRFPGKRDGMSYPELFCRTAYESYYELVYGLLDACDYGVPQHRTRFFCVGTRRDLFECDGVLGSLPAPAFFAPYDLERLEWEESSLFGRTEEGDLIRHAPGVRYFPDRKFIKPPNPNHQNSGRSKAHIEFYRQLLHKEPDRIVANPRSQAA